MKQVANVFLFLTLLCYFACNNPTAHKVPESVAEQAFDLKVNRFDKDLFALKTDSQSIPQFKKLASAYPDFFLFVYQKNHQYRRYLQSSNARFTPRIFT